MKTEGKCSQFELDGIVCRVDSGRSFYYHTGAAGSVFLADFFRNFSRCAVRVATRCDEHCDLSAAGIVRAAGLYQGSGLVLPTSADLWLSAGICSGSMAVRKNHRGSKKQQLSNDAGGLFFGSRCGFCRRVRILCTDYQPLAGKRNERRGNPLFDLFDFCAGGYPADGLSSLFRQSLAADSAAGAVDFPLSCLPCIFPQKGI